MREVISQNPYSTNGTDFKINVTNGEGESDALIVKKFENYLSTKYAGVRPSEAILQLATTKIVQNDVAKKLRGDLNLEPRNSKTKSRSYVSS